MRLLLSLAALAVLSTGVAAHADTFSYGLLYQSDGAFFTAINDYGDYVIQDVGHQDCYVGCFTASIGGVIYSRLLTAPTLRANPTSVAAGPGCNVTSAGYYTVKTICTNGYEFLLATATRNSNFTSIYAASDPNTPLGIVEQPYNFRVTDNGSLYFLLGLDDHLGRVLDETTTAAANAAITPEPSSFALLGTGVLGLAGLVRRRSLSSERA